MSSHRSTTRPNAPIQVLHFGRCELRIDTRELLMGGQLQPVRKRVFDLLCYLVAQRPRAVPHTELLRAIWQRGNASATLLARAVMETRRACGDRADDPQLVVSVHGVGYRFVGTVTEGPALAKEEAPTDAHSMTEMHSLLKRACLALDEGQHAASSDLYRMATAIAQRSGQLKHVLEWAQQRTAAHAAQHASEAAMLASVLKAVRNAGTLREELSHARDQISLLQREIAELRQARAGAGMPKL